MVKRAPFAGIAEQLIALVEIAGAERLQGVLLGQRFKKVTMAARQLPAIGKMIAQLADQAGLLKDPALAAFRMSDYLRINGVGV